jgi:hypothetical protein
LSRYRASRCAEQLHCAPGSSFDTSAAWLAEHGTISKDNALKAGRANHAAGIYTGKRVIPKKVNGRKFHGTQFIVADEWSTWKEKRSEDARWVQLDLDFLARHPRASGDTCKVFHVIAREQSVYGACALTTSDIAWYAGIDGTRSQSAAQKVSKLILRLIREDEVAEHADGNLTLPHYAHAVAEPDRLHAINRRTHVKQMRQAECDASEPATGPKCDASEPPSEFLTSESQSCAADAARVASDEAKKQDPALTETDGERQKQEPDESAGALPEEVEQALRAFIGERGGHNGRFYKQTLDALDRLEGMLDGYSTGRAVAAEEAGRQLRFAAQETHGRAFKEKAKRLNTAFGYIASPEDETWLRLKQEARERDEETLTPEQRAAFAELMAELG